MFHTGYAKSAIAHRLRGTVLLPRGKVVVMTGEDVGEEVGEEVEVGELGKVGKEVRKEVGEEVEEEEVGEQGGKMLLLKLTQEQEPRRCGGGVDTEEEEVQRVIRWAVVVIGVK